MVLVNSDLVDTLGVVVLPSISYGPSRLGSLHLCFRRFPDPRGTAAGNPGAAPSARRSAALREEAPTHSGGSLLMGWVVRRVERLAVQSLPGPSLHRYRLAPEGLSPLLDRESSIGKAGKARRAAGDPRFDSDAEP